MEYGKKIAYLRKSKGMTQEELGKVLNVTYQAVSKWERGESLPDFTTMSQMAKFFQVPLGFFEEGGESLQNADTFNDTAATDAVINETTGYIGICTECGKMLKEEEVFSYSPKIICKDCEERIEQQQLNLKKAEEAAYRRQKEHYAYLQRGSGIDLKLIITLLLMLACYGLCMYLSYTHYATDGGFYGFVMFLIPLAVFGIIQAFWGEMSELSSKIEPDGYTRNLSLIAAGIIAIINVVLFLILYLVSKEIIYIGLLGLGAVLSFTFVSQFLWGGVIQEIFTAGGFTFKLPGFIFSLAIDSILFMIIMKVVLGLISIALFIVTSIIMAIIAILGSVFTFIPSVISKTVKDKKV